MKSKNLMVTPLNIESFMKEYKVPKMSDKELCNEYFRYLIVNHDKHHYDSYMGIIDWYLSHCNEMMSGEPNDSSIEDRALDVIYYALEYGYNSKTFEGLSKEHRIELQGALQDIAYETMATMHSDDPSRFKFLKELDDLADAIG